MKYCYEFRLYINAKHSVEINGTRSPMHPHTWEIKLNIKVDQNDFINFKSFETELEKYLKIYDGQYLNDMEILKGKNPTVETLGKTLYEGLSSLFSKGHLDLVRMEISENPTRAYIIEKE